ncbi:MAG: glycosyltransferase family 4 protein, partial [Planctomycetota bacterium]
AGSAAVRLSRSPVKIHIHNRFSAHENRFFRAELDEIEAEITIQTGGPDLSYRTHWERIQGWGRLLRSAWRKSRRSLGERRASDAAPDTVPDAVFVQTHLELLVFVFRRWWSRRRRSDGGRIPAVALTSFIVAQNDRRISSKLRRAYYGRVLSVTDLAFCHARSDLSRYQAWYPRHAAKLRFQPFGYAVDPHESPHDEEPEVPSGSYLFAAGRSSRDYSTLIEAMRDADLAVFIACDSSSELPEGDLPSHVTILRNCFGRDFRAMVAGAAILVTPLQPVAHSAGQMVVLEGLAVGIPQVVTKIPGIVDYVDGGRAALLVPPRDPEALRNAVEEIRRDVALRDRLTQHGQSYFESHLTRQQGWVAMIEVARALVDGTPVRDVVLTPAERQTASTSAPTAESTPMKKAPAPPAERTGQGPNVGA